MSYTGWIEASFPFQVTLFLPPGGYDRTNERSSLSLRRRQWPQMALSSLKDSQLGRNKRKERRERRAVNYVGHIGKLLASFVLREFV